MGTAAQSLSGTSRTSSWLWEFLREELAPYPGRVSLVVRMVTASTLVVIIGMTFRIPYTAFAALFALVLSRESIEATANAARALVIGVVLGAAYVIIGALFVLGNPIGGFVIGIGAQVFILPGIDSIGEFAVLFIAVAGLSAWIATSSPRLSYLGLQIAAAFCLMNLEEFKFQSSLAVARDRVVGILLGLFMMWLAFDWLWSAPAGVEMKRTFVSAIRSLAQLAREPVSSERPTAIDRSYALRETINAQFDKV
jgi:uncharacterized membrane protein YccC